MKKAKPRHTAVDEKASVDPPQPSADRPTPGAGVDRASNPGRLETTREPTTTELALIAGLLRRATHFEPSLASDALDLWEACAKELQKRRENRHPSQFDQLCEQLPKPYKYPVSLDEFFNLMLPVRRRLERLKSYRHFLMAWKRLDLAGAIDESSKHSEAPVDEFDFLERAFLFQAWLKADLSATKSMNGAIGQRKKQIKATQSLNGTRGQRKQAKIKKFTARQIAALEKAVSKKCKLAVKAASEKWNNARYSYARGFIA